MGLKNGVTPLWKRRNIDEILLQIYLQHIIFVFLTDSACWMSKSKVTTLEDDIGSFNSILRHLWLKLDASNINLETNY